MLIIAFFPGELVYDLKTKGSGAEVVSDFVSPPPQGWLRRAASLFGAATVLLSLLSVITKKPGTKSQLFCLKRQSNINAY